MRTTRPAHQIGPCGKGVGDGDWISVGRTGGGGRGAGRGGFVRVPGLQARIACAAPETRTVARTMPPRPASLGEAHEPQAGDGGRRQRAEVLREHHHGSMRGGQTGREGVEWNPSGKDWLAA